MFYMILVSILVILILTRIVSIVLEELFPKKTKIDDKLIETKMRNKFKSLDITFGTKLYQQLRQQLNGRYEDFGTTLYANPPKNGINYRIKYIDTYCEEELTDNNKKLSTKPVMVLLHGTPGSVVDFEFFCSEFGQNYRLIIPQFPGFELTRSCGQFWHSNEERTQLIVTFLNKLSITEVDCLVCHSGGNPVALQMISGEFEGKLDVKSLVMITPPGFKWLSDKQLKNTRKMCQIVASLWRRWLYRFLLPDFVKIWLGVPQTLLKNCTREEFYTITLVGSNSGFESNIKRRYERLAEKRIPTLFVMADKDNLFPKWKFEKTLEFMSANREELFTYIGLNGETESESSAREWIQVLDFRFGGHFCFLKYSEVFHKYCQKFFETLDLKN